MDWDKTFVDLRMLNWFTLLFMSLISYFFMSQSLTLGIILGGFIVIANFCVLQRSIRRGFLSEGTVRTTSFFVVAKFFLRLSVLAIIIALLVRCKWIDPVGLALGLSTVVISIVSFGIKRALRSVRGEAI
ncbi:MAG: ATP synthase subunit I [Deltaproteobacteria bacterium]|nr:ATP synthase subunit I [Deltaproteobacteria bacterium]